MHQPPPCPDPERYILVKTHEGSFWRLKRGLKKTAVLNDKMLLHANYLSVSSKAASRMLQVLRPYLRGLSPGRINTRFSSFLHKSLTRSGKADYAFFRDYDFQKKHTLSSLLIGEPFVQKEEGRIGLRLSWPPHGDIIIVKNQLINGFEFSAILLLGDPCGNNPPTVTAVTSPVFLSCKKEEPCTLWLPMPASDQPWILFCKVSCYEENAPAHHYKHYAMKVMLVNS
ncbi:MAG: hypothetical protein HYU71_09710 [Bacteroidetes bacterium]|nr:hypothetical protein [Bacteroidota bacterium]